jgi:hypothetical protein
METIQNTPVSTTETYVCVKCEQELPIASFYTNMSALGHEKTCKQCRKAAMRHNYMKKYGIMPDNVDLNSPVSKFSSRELIAELRRRGYEGKLYYRQEIVL